MNGTIIAINRRNGFHAVRTEDGDVTVFELLDSVEPELGDAVSGALDSPGSEDLFNITRQESFSVFIQAARCSDASAAHLLKR